jgi:hypothetical protein
VLLEARQPTSPIRKTCAKTLRFSEVLEKAGGKSRLQPKKFVSKSGLRDWITDT